MSKESNAGWLQSGGLLYRLTDGPRPENRDEINVTMADGSRSNESRARRAGELFDQLSGNSGEFDGKHLNGAPKYSSTTFKDNGQPIMLNDDGTRSIFCDLCDDDDQSDPADEWRRLALQFDGHRMQALAHLRAMVDVPITHTPKAKTFLAAPPLPGEDVLAERIEAMAEVQSFQDRVQPWMLACFGEVIAADPSGPGPANYGARGYRFSPMACV